MKQFLFVCVGILLAASPARGQAGVIGIYGDPDAINCALRDAGPGVEQYFAVHTLIPGATAISFSAPLPLCHTGVWLSDTPVFPVTVGNSQTGVTIGYGGCLVAPIHVLTINVTTFGTTPVCCSYCTAPPAGKSFIEMVDCQNQVLFASAMGTVVNEVVTCAACLHVPVSCTAPVPTESSRWGRIKSLYRR